MKRAVAILLSLCLAGGMLAGCGNRKAEESQNPSVEDSQGNTPSSEPVKLKLGTCAPESSTFVTNAQMMNDKLEELSGGTVTIEIVSGGALGNVPEHFAQLNNGTLDIFVQGVDAPSAVKGGKDFGIFNVPFLFDDVEHFHKFLESDLFASMMEDVQEENQFSWLGLLGDRPPRSLSTKNTPVRVPEDLKGLVLRVPESAVPVAVFQAWGANTTTSAASAIFEGLQSGQFDGQDNGIEAMVVDGFMEVQNCYMEFDHTQQGIGAFISDAAKEKLSQEQMGWLKEALEYAYATTSKKMWEEEVPGYYTSMEEAGINVVSDVDVDAFREIVVNLIPQFEGEYFREGLYEEIRALADR